MEDGFLPVPRSFLRGLYEHPRGWGRIYLDFQARAAWRRRPDQRAGPARVTLEVGELIFAGEREEAERYGVHRNTLRDFLAEYGHLFEWPEGRPRRPHRLKLADYWPARLKTEEGPANPHNSNELQAGEDRTGDQGAGDARPGPDPGPYPGPRRGPENPLQTSLPSIGEDQGEDRKLDLPEDRRKRRRKGEVKDTSPPTGEAPSGAGPGEAPVHRVMKVLVAVGFNGAVQPSGKLFGEQAAVVKRMIEEHGVEKVELAIGRMRNLFPYSRENRPPFDAFDVERCFLRALAAVEPAVSGGGGARSAAPAVSGAQETVEAKRKREAEQMATHDAELRAWRDRMRVALSKEPRALVRTYADKAYAEVANVPFLQPSDRDDEETAARKAARRKQMREDLAFMYYGADHRDPMPNT